MVKSQTDWNSYAAKFEPCELEPPFLGFPLIDVFALKFDFGGRMHADIAGTITINDHDDTQVLFQRPTSSFLRMSPGTLNHMSGGREVCINGIGHIEINLDLVDSSVGSLKFQSNFKFYVDRESDNEEDEEEEKDDEEEEEDDEEEEEEVLPVEEELEERLYTRFDLWDSAPNCIHYDMLLRKELTGAHCSIEVVYAVYCYPRVVSVKLTFAGWNPSYIITRKNSDDACLSDGLCVFGQVTAHNTLLTNPDATTMLFCKAIDDHVVLKVGDVVPFSKSILVFPDESSLLLEIDLRHSLHKFLVAAGHKVPPSELLARKTLEINNRHDSYCRHIIEDCGPAKFFVDVHLRTYNNFGLLI